MKSKVAISLTALGLMVSCATKIQISSKKETGYLDTYDRCIDDVGKYEAKRYAALPEYLKKLNGEYSMVELFAKPMSRHKEKIIQLIRLDQEYEKNKRLESKPTSQEEVKEPLIDTVIINFKDFEPSCDYPVMCSGRPPERPPSGIFISYSQPARVYEFSVEDLQLIDGKHIEGSVFVEAEEVRKRKSNANTWVSEEKVRNVKMKIQFFEDGYIYIEWINEAFKPKLDQAFKQDFIALIKIASQPVVWIDDSPSYQAFSAMIHCEKIYNSKD